MIYPTLGISTFTHLIIVTAVKAKNFLGFNKKKNIQKKRGFLGRMFASFAIAAIMEFVVFFVVVSSFVILSAGATGKKSNFNVIKGAISEFKEKSIHVCILDRNCYFGNSPPDAGITLSWSKNNNINLV